MRVPLLKLSSELQNVITKTRHNLKGLLSPNTMISKKGEPKMYFGNLDIFITLGHSFGMGTETKGLIVALEDDRFYVIPKAELINGVY